MARPELDSLPPSPVDWERIAPGVEQEPNPRNDFQFSPDIGVTDPNHYRRNPDGSWVFIARYPESPL